MKVFNSYSCDLREVSISASVKFSYFPVVKNVFRSLIWCSPNGDWRE